jgi:hypothetical protein
VLTFAVVASQTGRPLDPTVLDRFEDRAGAEVPFPVDRRVSWMNDSGTIWFGGWQAPGRGRPEEPRWCIDADGLTGFAGQVWPRRDGWAGTGPVAEQLRQHLQKHPLVGGTDELAGVYVVASMASNGPCAVAADPIGAGLLYWARSAGVVVLSTRAAVAAELLAAATGTTPRRDVVGTGWLAYMGTAMGLRTGFEHVTLVPDGAVVEIDPAGTIDLHRSTLATWRHHADELAADPPTALEEARAEMVTAIRTALREPGTQGSLGLTGGKDSRLLLALLLAEGLASDIEYQTLGADDLPDVVVARQLASAFGLRHVTSPGFAERWAWRQRVDNAVRESTMADWPSREIAFRITAWMASGMGNAGEPQLGRLPHCGTAQLSGLFGESLRTNYAATLRFRSKAQAARFPDNLQPGSAGILDHEALARYRAELHELLFEGTTEGDSPQDVVDTFYLRQRLRHWLGTKLEVDTENRAFPLYSITAMRLAFAIGAENRHAEWIHYQLMRTSCEQLIHTPFTSGDWPSQAGAGLVAPATYADPVPPSPPPPRPRDLVHQRLASLRRQVGPTPRPKIRTVAREYRERERVIDLEIMRKLFRHDASNPAFELIDASAVSRALDHFDKLSEGQRLQLYGALTAVIWLGNHDVALPRELSVT